MVSRPIALCLTAACLLFGCSSKTPRTELMIVADTNLTNLQAIRFEISDDAGRNESAENAMPSDGPATLALVQAGDSTGPVIVTAKALRMNRVVVQRTAVVSFVPRQTRVVELHLLERCVGVTCSSGQTCTENGCESQALSDDDLGEWAGDAPTLPTASDAGSKDASLDAGSDAGITDAGDGGAADAGSLVDCGSNATAVDLQNSIEHCGMCKNACKPPRNAVAMCVSGECTWECRLLFDDCDQSEANGCEQMLTTDAHCGSCGNACTMGTMCNRLQGQCR